MPGIRGIEQGMRSMLPGQLTSFVGRAREIAEVERLLNTSRLLTLTGPGGSGKTRLAHQVAANAARKFEGGVYFVSLASVTDPALALRAIAEALDVRESPGYSLLDKLNDFLHDEPTLLVLDNFEQIVDAAPLVIELLVASPDLKVLVTSRERLQLYGEQEYPVQPLGLPGTTTSSPERLLRSEAVDLFVQRARAVQPDFELSGDNAAAVAEICRRLDGLPLAIELAAARIQLLPPSVILERLDNMLDLLKGKMRNLPERQQTLRGAIEWSYNLLSEEEKHLFRWMSVFAGGCTLDAAEFVCSQVAGANAGALVLETLASLVDKNLLRMEETYEPGSSRFTMLDTIHEYAREQLLQAGDEEGLRQRHAAYFLHLAEHAEPELEGSAQKQWLDRLETEHGNFRAALHWADRTGGMELALKLASLLSRFWFVRGHFTEGREWLGKALSQAGKRDSVDSVKAMMGAGWLAMCQGDVSAAHDLYEEALYVARRLGSERHVARILVNLGITAYSREDDELGARLLEEGLALGITTGDKWGTAISLNVRGELARLQENYTLARTLYEQSLLLYREIGDRERTATVLHNLGYAVRHLGELQLAIQCFMESLSVAIQIDYKEDVALNLLGLAGVFALTGQPREAARLLGTAEAQLELMGYVFWPADRVEYDRSLAVIREQLGARGLEAERAAGRAMPLKDAVTFALVETGHSGQDVSVPETGKAQYDVSISGAPAQATHAEALTRRELEVLRLLAADLSDAQIAERLFLSKHTVHAHLHSIYSKLDVRNRRAAVRYAQEHNLV